MKTDSFKKMLAELHKKAVPCLQLQYFGAVCFSKKSAKLVFKYYFSYKLFGELTSVT